jgi:hypothetical protein
MSLMIEHTPSHVCFLALPSRRCPLAIQASFGGRLDEVEPLRYGRDAQSKQISTSPFITV